MKMEEQIQIRSAVEEDFDRIEALCTERFGAGYLTRAEYRRWLQNPELFLVAEDGGGFCGFCCLMPESAEALSNYMKIDLRTVEAASGGKPVIHCRSAALVSSKEHCGVMYRMLSRELENARAMGFGAAFAPAWVYHGVIPMGHLMDLLGFEQIGIRDNLWLNQAHYHCVICGGRCRCQAAIYKKSLRF